MAFFAALVASFVVGTLPTACFATKSSTLSLVSFGRRTCERNVGIAALICDLHTGLSIAMFVVRDVEVFRGRMGSGKSFIFCRMGSDDVSVTEWRE